MSQFVSLRGHWPKLRGRRKCLLVQRLEPNREVGQAIVSYPTRYSLYWLLAIGDDYLYFNIQRTETGALQRSGSGQSERLLSYFCNLWRISMRKILCPVASETIRKCNLAVDTFSIFKWLWASWWGEDSLWPQFSVSQFSSSASPLPPKTKKSHLHHRNHHNQQQQAQFRSQSTTG